MNGIGMSEAVIALGSVLLGLFALFLYIWSLVWVYRDAGRRGKSGCLVALLAALIQWPLSLLLWLVFRPETPYRHR